MSARPYIPIAIIGALALAAGYAIVPRGVELAYLHLQAREYQRVIEVLEPELSAEVPSAWAVRVASDAYVALGDINGAIDVYERYVRAHPDDLDALRRLDGFLVLAGRTYSHMQTLAEIQRHDPSPDQLRELARLHRFFGRYDAWVTDIDALAADGEATPAERLQVMQYRAALGQGTAQLDGLADLASLYPDPVAREAMETLVAIMLGAGDPQGAFEQASEWDGMEDVDTALRIAGIFRTEGSPELTLRLLRMLESQAPDHPRLLTSLTWLEATQDEADRALERLRGLYDDGRLDRSLYPLLISIALGQDDQRTVAEVIDGLDLGELDPRLLSRLIENVVGSADPARAAELWAKLDPQVLDRRPALAAGLALLLGRREEAQRWVAIAERREDLTPREQMSLANVMRELGRPADALAIYRGLVDQYPDAEYGYLRSLAVALRHGLGVRDELNGFVRSRLRDPEMTAAGRQEFLQSAVHLGAGEAVIPILSDLAEERGGPYVDLYIQALVQAGAKPGLKAVLLREIEAETRIRHLTELAGTAFAESLPDVARAGYKRVVERDPDNKEALSRLGHLAFYAGDFGDARDYLDRYFALGGDDHLSNFLYGEVLALGPEFMRARAYYRRALEQIESDPAPDLYMQIVKGLALRRVGRPDEAVELFDRLLAENPDSDSVRSEFVRVLAELGRFERAIELYEAGEREQ